jgi:hypothetical protein
MFEENLNPVDEGQENVVDSQTDDISVSEGSTEVDTQETQDNTETFESGEDDDSQEQSENNQEVAAPDTDDSHVQSKEENAMYAKMRRKAEQEVKERYASQYRELQELTGLGMDETLEYLRKEKIAQEAVKYASENNMSEEAAKRLIETETKLKALEQKEKVREFQLDINKQKKELMKEPFFGELEDEIDTLVNDSLSKGEMINVDAAYRFLVGKNINNLLNKAKNQTQKQTIANIHDRANRGVSTSSDGVGDDVDISDIDMEMANAFGNDPKEIAKYKKSKLKK